MENTQSNEREEKGTSKSKKKISKPKLIALIVVLVIIWFLAVQVFAAERWDMVVVVKAEENIMGINPLDESLDFGDLSRNLGQTRYVKLVNGSKSDRYVMVWKWGEISDMVEIEKNNFVLEPGEEYKIGFKIQIPPSAETKQYKGKVMVFRLPKWF